MNQGRIWCVVQPTVGLPLFLGSVAVTSLIVHTAVLSNTTWFASFMQGSARAKTSAVTTETPALAAAAPTQGSTVAGITAPAGMVFAAVATPVAQASDATVPTKPK